jgi:hypothetical protein
MGMWVSCCLGVTACEMRGVRLDSCSLLGASGDGERPGAIAARRTQMYSARSMASADVMAITKWSILDASFARDRVRFGSFAPDRYTIAVVACPLRAESAQRGGLTLSPLGGPEAHAIAR